MRLVGSLSLANKLKMAWNAREESFASELIYQIAIVVFIALVKDRYDIDIEVTSPKVKSSRNVVNPY